MRTYFDAREARDAYGRWTSLTDAQDRMAAAGHALLLSAHHKRLAEQSLSDGDRPNAARHTATALAGRLQAALNLKAQGYGDPTAPPVEDLLSQHARVVTALRIQAHHARAAGRDTEGYERQRVYEHHHALHKLLKAAAAQGLAVHVVHAHDQPLAQWAGKPEIGAAYRQAGVRMPALTDAMTALRLSHGASETHRQIGRAMAATVAAHAALDAGDVRGARAHLTAFRDALHPVDHAEVTGQRLMDELGDTQRSADEVRHRISDAERGIRPLAPTWPTPAPAPAPAAQAIVRPPANGREALSASHILRAKGGDAAKHLAEAYAALGRSMEAHVAGYELTTGQQWTAALEARERAGQAPAGLEAEVRHWETARDTLRASIQGTAARAATAPPPAPVPRPALEALGAYRTTRARPNTPVTSPAAFRDLLRQATPHASEIGNVPALSPGEHATAFSRYQRLGPHMTPVIHMHDASEFIREGRYRTQHEHGKSSGIVADPDWRRRTETAAGLWDGHTPADAPVYGALGISAAAGRDVHTHDERLYGGISAELHPETMARTTFTHGDSLLAPGANVARALLNPEEAKAVHLADRGGFWGDDLEGTGYTEAQVMGGVRMSDVRAFRVHDPKDAATVRAQLDQAGHHSIPVYVLGDDGSVRRHPDSPRRGGTS